MSLAYQRATARASAWETWGTLIYGRTRIPLRQLVVVVGMTIFFAVLLLRTREAGLGQIWASVLFAVPLVAAGSLTRTVGLLLLARLFFVGAALMGVMYVLALVLITPLLGDVSRPRDFVVPTLEQLLLIAPLVVLLWRWRRYRRWSVGATDLLLMGAAVGVGFALVEHAYLREESQPSNWLSWLPIVATQERLIPGHPLWGALAGATIGLGLLLRHRGPIWLAVAASGSVVAGLDHIANNYTPWGEPLSDLLNLITANGWIVVVGFFVIAVACIGADLTVGRRFDLYVGRQLERPSHRALPPRGADISGVRDAWELMVLRRRLALARFHSLRLPEGERGAAAQEADRVDKMLAARGRARRGQPGGNGPSGSLLRASDASADGNHADGPTASGGGGASLLAFAVPAAGIGLAVYGALGATTALGPLAVLLDVGGNCDLLCLLTGGAAGGPATATADEEDESETEEEKDRCAGERRALLEAQGRVEMHRRQLKVYAQQFKKMMPEAMKLTSEAAELATAAATQLALYAAEDFITRVLDVLAGEFSNVLDLASGDPTVVADTGLEELPGIMGEIPYTDVASAFVRLNDYYQIWQGDMSRLEALADAEGLWNVQRWCKKMRELQSLGARGAQIANEMAEIEVELDRWNEELKRRKEALDDCEAVG